MQGSGRPGEQRDDDRLEILGALRGEVMVFESMTIRQISAHGAQIETRVPLQIDSLHSLRLVLGDRSVVVQGRVVHSRVAEVDQDAVVYRSGVEFVDMPAQVASVIASFLESLRQARQGIG